MKKLIIISAVILSFVIALCPTVSATSTHYYTDDYSADDDSAELILITICMIAITLAILITIIIATAIKYRIILPKKHKCKNCNQTLPDDSKYCHICGTKR